MIKKISLIYVLFSLLTLMGCSDDQPGLALKKQTSTKESKVSAPSTHPAEERVGSLALRPKHPTVSDILVAKVKDSSGGEFSWSNNGLTIEGATGAELSLEPFHRGDLITCDFEVGGKQFRTSVEIVNSSPRVGKTTFVNSSLQQGVDIELLTETEDADGDEVSVSYRWFVNDKEIPDQHQANLSGTHLKKGDKVAVWVTPADSFGDGKTFYSTVLEIPNAPPIFSSTLPTKFDGQNFSYTAVASDPDGDGLEFSLEAGPEGMNIDPQTGQMQWKIETSVNGDQLVRIKARDPEGATATQEFTLKF